MKRIFCVVIIGIVALAGLSCEVRGQGKGADLYRVRSAYLAQKKSMDFKIATNYQGFSQSVSTILSTGDTVSLGSAGSIMDLRWLLAYGLTPRLEFNVSGVTMVDRFAGGQRYGAGDTKFALRTGTADEIAPINLAGEVYYIVPIGFNEGTRLIRQFSVGHGSLGANFFSTFRMTRLTAHANVGYNHNGGRIRKLPARGSAFYYPILDGTVGIGRDTRVYTTSQANIGFGGDYHLFGKFAFFGEYTSSHLIPQKGEHLSLGNTAFGITYGNPDGFQFKLGYVKPSGSLQSGGGFIFELRLNDVFGRGRAWQLPPPTKPSLLPALTPGQKPFFRREGVLFAGTKDPVHDTVFLIDVSPTMIGRGIGSIRGENVLADLPNFINALIDSIPEGSNIALVTFANTVKSLIWSRITRDKKTDIQRAANDVPDEASVIARRFEAQRGAYPTVEDLVGGVTKAYQNLVSFKRGDYNRIHLQRLILITDDIADDSAHVAELGRGFEMIHRLFGVNNEDFRFMYYLLANREAGKSVPQHVATFVEQEDGAVIREFDPTRREEVIPRLNYNQKEELPSFKYSSQLSRIAIIPFKTRGKSDFGNELTKSFKSIFENNAYFVLAEQNTVDRLVQISGLSSKEKISVGEAQKIGMQLGVDYIALGEIKDFQVSRDKGLYVPYVAGLTKTDVQIAVGIDMVDVANGALVYSDVINASQDARGGINVFASSREDRSNYLSSINRDRLQQNLLASWRGKVIDRMFQDITTIRRQ